MGAWSWFSIFCWSKTGSAGLHHLLLQPG